MANKGLNNTYRGGLNSYGLSLLYSSFLSYRNLKHSKNHFKCLQNFFKFLKRNFNPETHAIAHNPYFDVTNPMVDKKQFNFSYLVVIDPTSFTPKNVTPHCSIYPDIVQTFTESGEKYNEIKNTTLTKVKKEKLKINRGLVRGVCKKIISKSSIKNILKYMFGLDTTIL